jgi:hypothetical protein
MPIKDIYEIAIAIGCWDQDFPSLGFDRFI